eukprot:6916859-Alexandrium_andersonii.AAC.1
MAAGAARGKTYKRNAGPSDPFQGRPAGQARTSAERMQKFMALLTPNYSRKLAGNGRRGRPEKR